MLENPKGARKLLSFQGGSHKMHDLPIRLTAADKRACDEALRTLERVLGPKWPLYAMIEGHQEQNLQVRQQSYIQLAIAVLEEIGKPTPITVLLERIRERRNDPTITRGSVETSLLRHLS